MIIDSKDYIGIDGCKFGWCCTIVNDQGVSIKQFKNIHELSFFFNHNFHALIDIPIGLGSKTIFRKVDQFLRNKLSKNFKSSVFNTPNRAAVYAEDYLNSKEINLYETEKSVSIQAWNICPKIKEIDTFLTKHSSAKISLTESHPELCFQELNNQTPLQFKKNCKEGFSKIKNIDDR